MNLWLLGEVKNSELITVLLALWGAALSTATTVLSVSLFFKDRPRVKVQVRRSKYFPTEGGKSLPCISVYISNSGRRPVTIESFFLQFRDGNCLHVFDPSLYLKGGNDFPIRLDEGTGYSLILPVGSIASEFRAKGEYPKFACYKDVLGQAYLARTSKKFWNMLLEA
ncbi:hypothetical protein KBD34_01805 [Patescibacteria group bacterium]|nr:hypothetical protein [Patescibacteria group bacterium]